MNPTQADVDAMYQQIVSAGGASVIREGNSEVRFETNTERLKVISMLQARVDAQTGIVRTRFAATSKGF